MSFYATLVLRLCRLMCGEARPHRQRPFHVNRASPEDGGRSPKQARGSVLESRRLSTHQAAQPLWLHNATPNRSIPSMRRHCPIGCTTRNPIGQFPPSGGTARFGCTTRHPIGQFPEATDAQAWSLGRGGRWSCPPQHVGFWRALPISRMPELFPIGDDHPSSVPPKQPILFQLLQQPAQIGLRDGDQPRELRLLQRQFQPHRPVASHRCSSRPSHARRNLLALRRSPRSPSIRPACAMHADSG